MPCIYLKIIFFSAFVFAIVAKAHSEENKYYLFDGNSLDSSLWGDFLSQEGSSFYSVENGRLNFCIPTKTTNGTENQKAVYYKPSLALDKNWTIYLGMRNSSYWSTTNGASQLQIALFNSAFLTNSVQSEYYIALLAASDSFSPNPKIVVCGSHTKDNPIWPHGLPFNSSQEISLKIDHNSSNNTLMFSFSDGGTDPIYYDYNYTTIASVQITNSSSLNLGIIQNVYDSQIPLGQMWVDNLAITYPNNASSTNWYSLELQNSTNLLNWDLIASVTVPQVTPKSFFRIKISPTIPPPPTSGINPSLSTPF